MEVSWRAGHAISIDTADTFADGIAVRVPVADSVTRINSLVDDIVLVSDAQMLEAMRIAASTLGLLLEPQGPPVWLPFAPTKSLEIKSQPF